MVVKKYFRLIWTYFQFNLAACMEYRLSFITQVVGMILNNAGFIIFWHILLDNTGPLAGYSMQDVMLIWALSSSGFGLAHILFGNCRHISRLIINGELDSFLLQPKNVYVNVMLAGTNMSAWGDFFYGYIVFFIFVGFKLRMLLLFSGFVFSGALFFAAFFSMLESLAFFTGSTAGLSRIGMELVISFSIYPDKIFPRSMRWIFYSLLPSGFIAFIPLRLLQQFNGWILLLLMGATLLYVFIAYFFFQWGLKRYESGNLMTTKL